MFNKGKYKSNINQLINYQILNIINNNAHIYESIIL